MNELLIPEITAILEKKKVKATYGALADMLGARAEYVISSFSKSRNNRWIVNAKTGLATGYADEFLDDDYRAKPIQLSDEDALLAFLSEQREVGNIPEDFRNLLNFLDQRNS